jgi:murein DD-endopeptidase MepM/ murein hydrolase activator NlpD
MAEEKTADNQPQTENPGPGFEKNRERAQKIASDLLRDNGSKIDSFITSDPENQDESLRDPEEDFDDEQNRSEQNQPAKISEIKKLQKTLQENKPKESSEPNVPKTGTQGEPELAGKTEEEPPGGKALQGKNVQIPKLKSGGRESGVEAAATKVADGTRKATALVKKAGQAIIKAAVAVGRFLFATPYGWIIVLAILIVFLLFGVGAALFGSTGQNPSPTGRSIPVYSPSYEIKELLSQVIGASNVADAEEVITKNQSNLIAALDIIEKDLQTNFPAAPTTPRAIELITALRSILESTSATDPASNQSRASEFVEKTKELMALFSFSAETLPGTTIPLKVPPIKYGSGNHWCTEFDPSDCNRGGHRSLFGIREHKAGVAITADTTDVFAPLGTVVYAPFTGKVHRDGGSAAWTAIIINSTEGIDKEAILGHCDFTGGVSEGSTVTVGQEVCRLMTIPTSGPHLHFELKIDGKDVRRTDKSQTQKDLWETMKTILNGQS